MNKLRCLSSVIAVAVTSVLGSVSAAHATYPGRNGLITFSAQTGGSYQIYTIRPDGLALHQVTNLSGDAVNPDWSPDGRQIVFEFDHPSGEPLCSIMVMNADGSNMVDLTGATNGCDAQPSFTPDGRRIVFERYDDITNVDSISSMSLSGGDRRQITIGTNNGVTDPNVSPDGTTLSFVDFNGQNFGQALYTSSMDGSNLHQLTPFTADVAIKQDWAPDGQHLVFTDNADFPQPGVSANISTIRPDGTHLHALTTYTGGQVNAFVGSYSPNGRSIVFRLEDHGQYGLYRMDAEGGHLHAILPLSTFRPRYIDWGPSTDLQNTFAEGSVASNGPGLSASFTVSSTSSTIGQGEVLFGAGPGCSGLVETATQDAGAGTTSHTVTVTGNDLPGTVGDNGIIPGATYWYEVVTVTKTGVETDNNGGKCYSVTVPTM